MDFKLEVAKKISLAVDMELEKVLSLIEIPPQSSMGDFAFPCFQLAKTMRKDPNMIATEFAGKFEQDNIIEKAEQAGGYLNFFVNRKEYINDVVNEVLAKGEKIGRAHV